jgi:hypothetical protein
VRCEIIVRAEFGAENGLAMVPQRVDALEQSVLVSLEGGLGKEPSEEHISHLALQSKKLVRWHCGWSGSRWGFDCLAFKDRLLALLMLS